MLAFFLDSPWLNTPPPSFPLASLPCPAAASSSTGVTVTSTTVLASVLAAKLFPVYLCGFQSVDRWPHKHTGKGLAARMEAKVVAMEGEDSHGGKAAVAPGQGKEVAETVGRNGGIWWGSNIPEGL